MTTRDGDPTIRAIIEAARSAPARGPARGAWLTAGLSGLLFWASFPPLDWSPLAWIALAPLMLLVRSVLPPRHLYLAAYVCGFISQIGMLQWFRYGDPAMYLALFAVSAYLAVYFPAFVLLSRTAVHRFGVPFVLALPTVWVGLEYCRSYLFTGFAWYYLGHTQYRWTELIQVSDLVGAYGVSFIVAASAAALALACPESWLVRLRIGPPADGAGPIPAATPRRGAVVAAVAFSLCLASAAVVYGYVRRAQARFVEGPRVALIQGNFAASVKHEPGDAMRIFNTYHHLTGFSVHYQPDVILWPEGMYRDPLMLKSPDLSDADVQRLAPEIPPRAWTTSRVPEMLGDLAQQAGAAMVFGLETFTAAPGSSKRYNSAVFAVPGRGIVARYDKMHRVVFGEYIPLKDWLPFLTHLVPFEQGFGLDAGTKTAAFDVNGWRLAPQICFEDTVPQLVRATVRQLQQGDKPVDCLVNISNDGWFHGSSGLDQHLITASFRCVECRKPMVRAVNTGISAVIDGDGVIVEPDVFYDADNNVKTTLRDPKTGRWRRQLDAVLIDSVPLDNRTSLYVRYGDWFAAACGLASALFLAGSALPRRFMTRKQSIQPAAY